MKTLAATRYVTPLREGGSLPAVVETPDGGLYVAKFRGAGQGTRALVAELIVGELARAIGLDVPELALIELDAAFGRNEPDPEIRDLLRASVGTNLGLVFLPGAIAYDPAAPPAVDETLASTIVWLDAFTLNVDRTPRNPNLLLADGRLWVIDHGAALYFHHAWSTAGDAIANRFPLVKDHVLLPRASRVAGLHARLSDGVRAALAGGLLDWVPGDWIAPGAGAAEAASLRRRYHELLTARLDAAPDTWLEEWEHARRSHV